MNWTHVGDFNDFSLILEKDKYTQCMCNVMFRGAYVENVIHLSLAGR